MKYLLLNGVTIMLVVVGVDADIKANNDRISVTPSMSLFFYLSWPERGTVTGQ